MRREGAVVAAGCWRGCSVGRGMAWGYNGTRALSCSSSPPGVWGCSRSQLSSTLGDRVPPCHPGRFISWEGRSWGGGIFFSLHCFFVFLFIFWLHKITDRAGDIPQPS